MIIRLLKFICFSFVLLITSKVNAQRDLIITNAGEEIRCKILDETATRFKYAYLGPKNKVLRNEIFKNLVSSFKYSHYNDDLLKNEKLNQSNKRSAQPRIDTRKSSSSNSRRSKDKEDVTKIEAPEIKIAPSKKENKVADTKINDNVSEKKVSNPEKKNDEKSIAKTEDKKSNVLNEEVTKISEIPKTEDKKDPAKVAVKDSSKVLKTETAKIVDKKPEVIKIEVVKNNEIPKTEDKKEPAEVVINDSSKVLKTETAKIVDNKSLDSPKKIEPKAPTITNDQKKENEVKVVERSKEKSPFAEPEPISEFRNYMKYRIGVKGGLGNIIQKSDDTSPYGLYKEKLLRGWMFGADAAYFFNDNVGFGAVYTNYQASNASKNLDYPNFITKEIIKAGELSNNVSHKFVGPTFLYRKSIDFKTFAVLTLSPGMHYYTDKGLSNLSNFKYTGKAYGASATLGIDFLLGNDIYGRDIILSLEGGYNYGQITSLNYGGTTGTQTLATPINLNRLDFSIGLRFTRFPVYLR